MQRRNRIRLSLLLIAVVLFLFGNFYIYNNYLGNDIESVAGIYTPFAFTPGGGERVTLYTMLGLQNLGYKIVLFLEKKNVCRTVQCIEKTAEILNIEGINFKNLKIVLGSRQGRERKLNTRLKMDVFWTIGNTKVPRVYGEGSRYNMYTCQFPFDGRTPTLQSELDILSSYDSVLTYSLYSSAWYTKVILPSFIQLNKQNKFNPSVEVVYPPSLASTLPMPELKNIINTKSEDKIVHIVVLGRFFQGRQNKGQPYAVEAFKRLLAVSDTPMELHLIGNIQPKHEEFVASLQQSTKGFPISFHIGSTTKELESILKKSILYWHMTGIDQPESGEDAASLEHFGISIVEAMSFGCIPIVLNRGGPAEIVTSGYNGYTAADVDGFVDRSLYVMVNMKASVISTLQRNAIRSVDRYTTGIFMNTMNSLVTRGIRRSIIKSKYRADYLAYIPTIPSIAPISPTTAVLFETSIDALLPHAVRNVMTKLGSGWSLHIHHSSYNELYVKTILQDIPNIKYTLQKNMFYNFSNTNEILKSNVFWSHLSCESVLIFNSETFMLHGNIHPYLKYAFIGAPLGTSTLVGKSSANGVLSRAYDFDGSFSLRSVRVMERITRTYASKSLPSESESSFFTRYVTSLGLEYPNLTVAYTFCRVKPIDMPKELSLPVAPMAVNAAWHYFDPPLVKKYLSMSDSYVYF